MTSKTKKTTRWDVRRKAKEFGAEVVVHIDSTDMLDMEVIAPEGYHWDEDVHALVGHCTDTRFKHEVYEDLIDRMTGIEPCTRDNSNCQYWHGWED